MALKNLTTKKLTAKNMKDVLWGVLQDVKNKKMDVAAADAIASQSREIIRVIRTQQSLLGQAKEGLTKELREYALN